MWEQEQGEMTANARAWRGGNWNALPARVAGAEGSKGFAPGGMRQRHLLPFNRRPCVGRGPEQEASWEAPAETQVGNDRGCGSGGWDGVRLWGCVYVCVTYEIYTYMYTPCT